MSRAAPLAAVSAALALSSCATVGKVSGDSLAFVRKTSAATTERVTEISNAATTKVATLSTAAIDKIHPPTIKVVEVREKDLKPVPTGKQQALAFENTRKRGFFSSFFDGPVDFVEPELPKPGADEENVDILLPPKTP